MNPLAQGPNILAVHPGHEGLGLLVVQPLLPLAQRWVDRLLSTWAQRAGLRLWRQAGAQMGGIKKACRFGHVATSSFLGGMANSPGWAILGERILALVPACKAAISSGNGGEE